MKKRAFIIIVIIMGILLSGVFYFSLRQSASAQTLEKLPVSGARNVLMAVRHTLQQHGLRMDVRLYDRLNADTVNSARQSILDHSSIVLLAGAEEVIVRFEDMKKNGFPTEKQAQAIKNAVRVGDYHVGINLHLKDGSHVYTEFSLSPDGTRKAGAFIDGSRVANAALYSNASEGQQCEKRVIGHYLHGAPAEMIDTCIDFGCQEGRVKSCLISKNDGVEGFMHRLTLQPDTVSDGVIKENRCYGTVKYKIELLISSFGLEIKKMFGFDVELGSSDGFRSFTVSGSCRSAH